MTEKPSIYDVVAPLFRKDMMNGKEQELEELITIGLPVEQYFIFFQEAMTWLLEKHYIDNLRYLELAQFLDSQKRTMHDIVWYKERMAVIMNAVSKPIMLLNRKDMK